MISKSADPSVEDILYMIDEQGREACSKTLHYLYALQGKHLCVLCVFASLR